MKRAILLLTLLSWTATCGGGEEGLNPLIFLALGGPPAQAAPTVTCTAPCNLQLTWNALHEKDVNASLGGYKVCYAATQGFSPGSGTCLDVPYVSGPTAPTTKNVTLQQGRWYVKIYGYSQYTSQGTVSTELSVQAN